MLEPKLGLWLPVQYLNMLLPTVQCTVGIARAASKHGEAIAIADCAMRGHNRIPRGTRKASPYINNKHVGKNVSCAHKMQVTCKIQL